MTTKTPAEPVEPVIFDSRILWHLAKGTRFVELDSGRVFTVGDRPGRLWRGNTPCSVESIDMPVQIRNTRSTKK
ncbi:hypothetical protein [Rhodococcus sp. RDE2]|uniref:hypothetical protein n=1 Tax=Rhodococcus sp. RDE2 TaxID=2885078 RepID=UPI001E42B8D7|nr:hypothetical protein [Rhodococcus sp. RDE2]BDB62392.1 hypothetical protein RDE2_41860 [Rhodococcus sp. RDE2]